MRSLTVADPTDSLSDVEWFSVMTDYLKIAAAVVHRRVLSMTVGKFEEVYEKYLSSP